MFCSNVYSQTRPEQIQTCLASRNIFGIERGFNLDEEISQFGMVMIQTFAHILDIPASDFSFHLKGASRENIILQVNLLMKIRLKRVECAVKGSITIASIFRRDEIVAWFAPEKL